MLSQRVRTVGLLLGLLGLGVAVATTAQDVEGTVLPDVPAFAVAGAAAVISLLSAGRSWATLLDAREHRREVLGALYLSQLSKYLPAGGLLQAAGQVTMSVKTSIPIARTAVAYPVAMLEIVIAGAVLASGLVLSDELPWWGRILAGVAPLGAVLLHPRFLRGVLAIGRRVSARVPAADHLPPSATVVRSTGWALLNMIATTVAFVVLLRSIAPDTHSVATFSAFAAAWVIGFLVVPLPSGLGVREAILVLAVPGLAPGQILAASLAHRIVTVAAEVLVTSANALLRHDIIRRRAVP